MTSLSDRYTRESGTVFLTGIQALVRTVRDRARLDRRQNLLTASLVSGYEGSPLAGYDLELARRAAFLDPFDVVHRPALNEEAGATAVMGSQLARRTGTLRATAHTAGAALQGALSGADTTVQVVTAYALDPQKRAALGSALSAVAQRTLTPEFHEDPMLKAGVCVRAGAWMLMANLRDELEFFGSNIDHG